MIKISPNANKNYLAKVVQLKGLHKHPNADKLQITTVDFQNVITGMEAQDGDVYVYFPLECTISREFLSFSNSYRDKELNADKDKVGFFEVNRRVRAVKLRGEKSMGIIFPAKVVEDFAKGMYTMSNHIGEEFDQIGDHIICEKYIVKTREFSGQKKGKSPKASRLIDGIIKLHVDTENLRKNAYKINPDDIITISYKEHGTSGHLHHLPVKRKLNFVEKLLQKLGVKIQDTEYDFIYGSRKVIKNQAFNEGTKEHFYDSDIWGDAAEDLKQFLPKGMSLYFEITGYTRNATAIQGLYDYGCAGNGHKITVYRITFTNEDGLQNELTTPQILEFCQHFNIKPLHVFYHGRAGDKYPALKEDEEWTRKFIEMLEYEYTDKKCFMCRNDVVEEGIVLRKERMFEYEAYKLKSWKFLEMESQELDKGQENLEDNQ